jgi:hypothetical protein
MIPAPCPPLFSVNAEKVCCLYIGSHARGDLCRSPCYILEIAAGDAKDIVRPQRRTLDLRHRIR